MSSLHFGVFIKGMCVNNILGEFLLQIQKISGFAWLSEHLLCELVEVETKSSHTQERLWPSTSCCFAIAQELVNFVKSLNLSLLHTKECLSLSYGSLILGLLILDKFVVGLPVIFDSTLSLPHFDVHAHTTPVSHVFEIITGNSKVDLLEFQVLIDDQ